MTPNIAITPMHLQQSSGLLSVLLANEMTLYIKTRKFHWNVTGESFMEMHKLFEAQYTQLEKITDQVAERIGMLGGKAIGTMHEFTLLSKIIEHPNEYLSQKAMLTELLINHETIISALRKDVESCTNECHDAGSADMLSKIMQQHESTAWILRRYLN